MKITIQTANKKKPCAGDRRETKARGKQIRVPKVARCGAWVVSSGRQCYEWIGIEECANSRWSYLLSDSEVVVHQPF